MRCITNSVLFIVLAAGGCSAHPEPSVQESDMPTDIARGTMKLTSSAFRDGMGIGARFTVEGQDVAGGAFLAGPASCGPHHVTGL